jgi:hypothetical protein
VGLSQHTTPLAPIPVLAQLYAAQQQHQLQQQAQAAYGAQQQQQVAQTPWNPWKGTWDQQSLASFFNTMTLQQPQSITEWIADSGASNHTTLDSGNISRFRSPTSNIPSSIVVGNGSSLPVTSVGDTVLSGQFYLNNVLVTPDIIKNLLSVRQFTTDNNCSMEFDPFGLSVKDLSSRNTILRCNSSGSLYTISLPTARAPPATTHYGLAAVTTPASLWHQRLGHPGPDVLAKLSSIVVVSCNKPKHVLICHACQLGRHTRLPFAQSMSRATQCFDLVHLYRPCVCVGGGGGGRAVMCVFKGPAQRCCPTSVGRFFPLSCRHPPVGGSPRVSSPPVCLYMLTLGVLSIHNNHRRLSLSNTSDYDGTCNIPSQKQRHHKLVNYTCVRCASA